MKQIGSFMVIIGLLAIGLDFINRVPTLLLWIYNWGEIAAWGIKIGLVAIGAVLYLMGSSAEETPEE